MYSYDNLDRLTVAQYAVDTNEVFTMDDLGNRTNVNEKGGSNTAYTVDTTTNRYTEIGGTALEYDYHGNLTEDKNDYQYEYDYENRLVKVMDSANHTIAEYDYDALGRRIYKNDPCGSTCRVYYYNDNWQILSEYDYNAGGPSQTHKYSYVYGNSIDEVVLRVEAGWGPTRRAYLHDHLYSVACMVRGNGDIVERYEYDAYGQPTIYKDDGGDGDWFDGDETTDSSSNQGNIFMFTGREVDILDNNDFTVQYNRHRYYSYDMGRWLTKDPIGYLDGLNTYGYVLSNPVSGYDPLGLFDPTMLLFNPGSGSFYNNNNNNSLPIIPVFDSLLDCDDTPVKSHKAISWHPEFRTSVWLITLDGDCDCAAGIHWDSSKSKKECNNDGGALEKELTVNPKSIEEALRTKSVSITGKVWNENAHAAATFKVKPYVDRKIVDMGLKYRLYVDWKAQAFEWRGSPCCKCARAYYACDCRLGLKANYSGTAAVVTAVALVYVGVPEAMVAFLEWLAMRSSDIATQI